MISFRLIPLAPQSGEPHVFEHGKILLGSSPQASIRVIGEGISPFHACIEIHAEKKVFEIFDLDSFSGTFINGRRLTSADVRPGDRITIGRYEFLVQILGLQQSAVPTPVQVQVKRPLLYMEEAVPFAVAGTGLLSAAAPVTTELKPWDGVVESPVLPSSIFKSRAFAKPAVEVTQLWEGVPLKMAHFSSKAKSEFEDIRIEGDGHKVTVQAKNPNAGFPYEYEVTEEGIVEIPVATFVYRIRFSPAIPRLKWAAFFSKDSDLKDVAYSILCVFLTLLLALGIKNAPLIHSTKTEPLPDRFAAIIYEVSSPQPEAVVQPLPPKKEKEKKASVTVDLENVKPTQKKAVLDLKNLKDTPKKTATKKIIPRQVPKQAASEGRGVKVAGAEGRRETVEDLTSSLTKILAQTSARLGSQGKKVKNLGNFSGVATGGAALSGRGSGGGGDEALLGGMADDDRGAGKVGTGLAAAGKGVGILGDKARVELRMGRDGDAIVDGGMDRGAIAAAIEAQRDAFRLCYEREVNAQSPDIEGTVRTLFVIGAAGRVLEANIERSTLRNPTAEECVLGVLRRIIFPSPPEEETVRVTYPFKFERFKKERASKS